MDQNSKQSVYFQYMLHGGIVNNIDTALAIARAIVIDLYGVDELRRQEPLSAALTGDKWVIDGNFNRNREKEGDGPVKIEIMRKDGQVVCVYMRLVLQTPKEVQEMMRQENQGSAKETPLK